LKQLICVIILLSRLRAVEKDNVGSVVIFSASQQKIVIGADSRVIEFSPITGLMTDKYDKCKLITLSRKFVFSAVGKAGHESEGHPEFTWDIFQIARKIARGYGKNASLKHIANAWGREVSALDDRDVHRGVVDPRSTEGQLGLFAGFAIHKPVVYEVRIYKLKTGSYSYDVKPVELVDGQIFPAGPIDIATEFAAHQTYRSTELQKAHPSGDWNSLMPYVVDFVIEKTISDSVEKDKVGRPIDLIEINDLRLHWIRKKDGCE
jgi:hypothetical protein